MMPKNNEFDLKVIEFKRELVRRLLDQCTEKQIDIFNRMYVDINSIKEDNMETAYFQCKRTVERNNE